MACYLGCPPRFHPLKESLSLPRDEENTALPSCYPKYTHVFEPLLRSVQLLESDFDMDTADVVSNAGNLHKLFELLKNKGWMAKRFDLELRGNTLLISRWTDDPNLARSVGRGVGFERKTCLHDDDEDPVVRNSASHHRVVTYLFGGLRCVVQSEADAYFCDCDHPLAPLPHSTATQDDKPALKYPDPLPHRHPPPSLLQERPLDRRPQHVSRFAVLTLDDPGDSEEFAASRPPPPPTTAPSPTVLIHHHGRIIPAACLVEVKTQRAGGQPLPFLSWMAQLYFAQRTKLYVAKYKDKVFEPQRDMEVQKMERQLRQWEQKEQKTLKKLAALLQAVRERMRVLRVRGVEKVAMVCESKGGWRDSEVSVILRERESSGGIRGLMPDGCGKTGVE